MTYCSLDCKIIAQHSWYYTLTPDININFGSPLSPFGLIGMFIFFYMILNNSITIFYFYKSENTLPQANPCFQPTTSMSTIIGLQAQDYSLQIKVTKKTPQLILFKYMVLCRLIFFFFFRSFQNL